MWRYFIKRILLIIPVALGVSFIVFFIINLAPGDVVDVIASADATMEEKEIMREEMGLNRSVFVQYGDYILGMLKGDMGVSAVSKLDVFKTYLSKLPNTLRLGATAVCIALILSIPLGIFSALKRATIWDYSASVFGLLGMSIPSFWLGLLLIIAFALKLRWFPSYGADQPTSVILPALTIGLMLMASMMRTTRSAMLDVLSQDYLRTARAKGVPEKTVITKHALRNALIPIITVTGAQLAVCLGGSVVTESVFSWPGVGKLIIDAVNSRDTQMVVGCIIIKTIGISLILLAVDLLYAVVDPRMKARYAMGGKKRAKAS